MALLRFKAACMIGPGIWEDRSYHEAYVDYHQQYLRRPTAGQMLLRGCGVGGTVFLGVSVIAKSQQATAEKSVRVASEKRDMVKIAELELHRLGSIYAGTANTDTGIVYQIQDVRLGDSIVQYTAWSETAGKK